MAFVNRVAYTGQFKKNVKKLKKEHKQKIIDELKNTIQKLINGEISSQKSNHPLKNANGLKDIHITGNVLLLYKYSDEGILTITLILHNIGNHDQLNQQTNHKIKTVSNTNVEEFDFDKLFESNNSPLTAFEKKAKDTAEKLGLGIKFTGNDRFELDTLDKEKVQEFYKEVFNVDIGDLKGLNENMLPNEEYIKTHEEEIENTVQTNYFYEIVNNLIKDEIEAITGYDKAITSFVNLGIMNYIDILKDIANEEKVHIGQLQTILEDLKPGTEKKFDDGQKEGKEQIVQEETNEEENKGE